MRPIVASEYGEYSGDDAIEASRTQVLGWMTSTYPTPGRCIISYEYVYGSDLYIGYQRGRGDLCKLAETGDEVEIEIDAAKPARSRLHGTLARPDAERTRLFDRWTHITARISAAMLLLGMSLGIGWLLRFYLDNAGKPKH